MRTRTLWPSLSNFVELPERYVLFAEILDSAKEMMFEYERGQMIKTLPGIRFWSPAEVERTELKQGPSASEPTSAIESTSHLKVDPGGHRSTLAVVASGSSIGNVESDLDEKTKAPAQDRSHLAIEVPDQPQMSCKAESESSNASSARVSHELMWCDPEVNSPTDYESFVLDFRILLQNLQSNQNSSKLAREIIGGNMTLSRFFCQPTRVASKTASR